MNRMLKLGGFAVAGLVVLALAAAAGTNEFPKGTFTMNFKGDDWGLHFDGKGKVTVQHKGKEVVEGTYKAAKDQVEFTDVKGDYAEQGDAKTGSYRWKLADGKLTFTKVKDEAMGRSLVLTAGEWKKKE